MAQRVLTRSRRRTIVVYVAAIVVPSLVLLILSWQSVERQRRAIASLTTTNRFLATARLASRVEDAVGNIASECLADAGFKRLASLEQGASALRVAEYRRATARELAERCRLASTVFVLDTRGPGHPLVQLPLPPLVGLPGGGAAERSGQAAGFTELLATAEHLELARGRHAEASAAYGRAAERATTRQERAVALSRLARSLDRAGHEPDARRHWVRLARDFPFERDAANQPFGLVASYELGASIPETREVVESAYRHLLEGRWLLGANELEYFASAFERLLGRSSESRATSLAFAEARLARALDGSSLEGAALPTGQRRSAAIGDQSDWFVFYTRPAPEAALVGFALDLEFLRRRVLPRLAADLQLPDIEVRWRGRGAGPGSGDDGVSRPAVPFTRDLTGFELLGPQGSNGSDSTPAAWVFAGSTVLTLGALGLGVLLLVRDTVRERDTNQLRADLVSGVSHELKTPLTLIRVYAETLDDESAPADEERHRFCGVITRETDRLTSLIDRVLTFSRVERGERTYQFQTTGLAGPVRATLDGYAVYLRARGFTVTDAIAPDLPPVPHDADAVAEALVNLLDNAAKYSGDGTNIQVGLFSGPRGVVLEVADRGIGIPAAEHGRIFDRFYRTERELGKGGYGLGLFLVKHIMDAHGGTVEVDSAPGAGSRFRLVFPTASPGKE